MIRETIVSALQSGRWGLKDVAEQLEIPYHRIREFHSGQKDPVVPMLDDLCDLLGLELMKVFTDESWEAYLETAWEAWGSKEPAKEYAAAKSDEWQAYRNEKQLGADDMTNAYDAWSAEYDTKEYDLWEDAALLEFESQERERLMGLGWVRWD